MALQYSSTSSKKNGKKKFRNAEEARRARELEQSWNELTKKWGVEKTTKTKKTELYVPKKEEHRGSDKPKLPSLNNGVDTGIAARAPDKVYTGSDVIGISIVHKSCLQPIFNKDAAVDVAKMRR